jgi:biotin synthase
MQARARAHTHHTHITHTSHTTKSPNTQDRLATLEAVRDAGISVCAGGIIGLGEAEEDRVGLLLQVRRA